MICIHVWLPFAYNAAENVLMGNGLVDCLNPFKKALKSDEEIELASDIKVLSAIFCVCLPPLGL